MRDWFYRFGRAFLNQSIRLYYRRIDVAGRELIPPLGPAILVANHPNSVTDAFLLASQLTSRKINFIAKDSITRAPLTGWIVRKFGVVGVARGIDYERERDLARQRNQMAMATCEPRLVAGELIAIFGEGISNDARRLHTIRKGAMRFGYAAERASGFKLGLLWVPVGITYSAKQRFRSDVFVRIGKPFRLSDLDDDPAAHQAKVLQRGTERLQRDLEGLIVNIDDDGLATLIDRLSQLFGGPTSSLASQVERQKHIALAVQYFNVAEPGRLAELDRALGRYQASLAAANLTDEIVRQRHPGYLLWTSALGLVATGILLVLNLYGWANGFVPRWAARIFGPFGRSKAEPAEISKGASEMVVARESLWGTLAGWVGTAVAFPLQTYLVFHFVNLKWGLRTAAATATAYALSLIPSWRLYVRRRDILHRQFVSARTAANFLLHLGPANRLQRRRRGLLRQVRRLVADYDSTGPRSTAS